MRRAQSKRQEHQDLEARLESYFSTLRSSPVKAILKRKLEHWPIYAAVGGSAVAMATGASASVIATGTRLVPEAIASMRAARVSPSPRSLEIAIYSSRSSS